MNTERIVPDSRSWSSQANVTTRSLPHSFSRRIGAELAAKKTKQKETNPNQQPNSVTLNSVELIKNINSSGIQWLRLIVVYCYFGYGGAWEWNPISFWVCDSSHEPNIVFTLIFFQCVVKENLHEIPKKGRLFIDSDSENSSLNEHNIESKAITAKKNTQIFR